MGVAIGLTAEEADSLADWYGTNIDTVYGMADKAKTFGMPLRDALQLAYALEYEMALTPEDFFGRRTDTLLFAIDKMEELKDPVLDVFESELNWTEKDRQFWEEQLYNRIDETSLKQYKNK